MSGAGRWVTLAAVVAGSAAGYAYVEGLPPRRKEELHGQLRSWLAEAHRTVVQPAQWAAEDALAAADELVSGGSSALLPGQLAAAWRAYEVSAALVVARDDDSTREESGRGHAALGEAPLVQDDMAEALAGPWAMRKVRKGMERAEATGDTAFRREGDLLLIRTRFFDEYLLRVLAETRGPDPITQIVLVAAACDSRPYRLQFGPSSTVFELDSEPSLRRKNDILAKERSIRGAQGVSVVSVACELDLHAGGDHSAQRKAKSGNWPAKLLASGFDPNKPSVWLLEGALSQATEAQALTFLRRMGELAGPASRCCLSMTSPLAAGAQSDANLSGAGSSRGRRTREGAPNKKKNSAAWVCADPTVFLRSLGFQTDSVVRAGSPQASFGRWPSRKEGASVYVECRKADATPAEPPAAPEVEALSPVPTPAPEKESETTVPSSVPTLTPEAATLQESKREMVQQFLRSDDRATEVPMSEVTAPEESMSRNVSERLEPSEAVDVSVSPSPLLTPSAVCQATTLNVVALVRPDILGGGSLRLCGNTDTFGAWEPTAAPEIEPNTPTGTELTVSEPGYFEFKCVIVDGDGSTRWEAGGNRGVKLRRNKETFVHVSWNE